MDRAIEYIDVLQERAGRHGVPDSTKKALTAVVREKIIQGVLEDGDFRKSVLDRLHGNETWSNAPHEREVVFQVVDLNRHVAKIVNDIKNVPARLLGAEQELWNAWDRLRAEGEFRISLATALIPLGLALSLKISPWCVVTGVFCVTLWVLGERKSRQATSMLFESLMAGRVSTVEFDRTGTQNGTYWLREKERSVLDNLQKRARIMEAARKSRTLTEHGASSSVAGNEFLGLGHLVSEWARHRAIWSLARQRKVV